jgi:hypothetical protein
MFGLSSQAIYICLNNLIDLRNYVIVNQSVIMGLSVGFSQSIFCIELLRLRLKQKSLYQFLDRAMNILSFWFMLKLILLYLN